VDGNTADPDNSLGIGHTLVIDWAGGKEAFTVGTTAGTDANWEDLVGWINDNLGENSASINADGRLQISRDVKATLSGTIADRLNLAGNTETLGTGAAGELVYDGDGSYTAQFNEARRQIANAVEDAGYRGTNLLRSDNLNVQFSERLEGTMTVNGVDYNMGASSRPAGLHRQQRCRFQEQVSG